MQLNAIPALHNSPTILESVPEMFMLFLGYEWKYLRASFSKLTYLTKKNQIFFLRNNPFNWRAGNASVFLCQHHFQHHRFCLNHSMLGGGVECIIRKRTLKLFACILPCTYIKLTKFYTTLFCPYQWPSFLSPLRIHTTPTPYFFLKYHGNIINFAVSEGSPCQVLFTCKRSISHPWM